MGKIFVWGLLNKHGRRKTHIVDRNAKDLNIYQGWKKTWVKRGRRAPKKTL